MYGKQFAAGGMPPWAAFRHKASQWQNQFGAFPLGSFYRRPKHNVPINITEQDAYFEVHVYALGFAKENIRLTVVDDVLFIHGTRPFDENNPPNFIQQEYPVRSFERRINLHGQVDTSQIQARQEAGVLLVRLPKTAESQQAPQEITIA